MKMVNVGTEVVTACGRRGTLTKYEDGRAVVLLCPGLSVVTDAGAVAPVDAVEVFTATVNTPGVEVRKYTEAPYAWQRSRWVVRVGRFHDLARTRAEALKVAGSMLAVAQWQDAEVTA